MLAEAGIQRGQCFLTYVLRIRPPGNDVTSMVAVRKADISPMHVTVRDKFVLPPVADGISRLQREIELCRPNVIIALGNLALWALTGNWGIISWRGSVIPCDLPLSLEYQPKVVPTYNPNAVMQQWSWRQVGVTDLRRAKKEAGGHELNRANYEFLIRPDYATTISLLSQFLKAACAGPLQLAVDIETRAGQISCIGLAWSARQAICIPFMDSRAEGQHYWQEEEELDVVELLQGILTHPNTLTIGQNFSYDIQYIERLWGFTPGRVRDTMLAQHSCFSSMQKSLAFLSSMYCEDHIYWKDDGKDWDPSKPEEEHWTYNATDCVRTFEIDTVEQRNVDALGLRSVHDFQQSLFFPVLRTMRKGIRSNNALRGKFAAELFEAIAEREQLVLDLTGTPLNPKSPKQMTEFFYGALNLKPVKDRRTGAITCNDEALRTLASREPVIRPLVAAISELRSLGVFLSTFVSAPLDRDGRIRCSFNIAGTETYRFSSSKNAFGTGLNLQNIPSGSEDSSGLALPNVRKLFIPDPGKEFFDIDLSSADLRIVVWESDETEMKALLKAGLDPYTEIAKEFYHDPTITKKDPRRQTFKSFAHGTNYLGSAKGLAERLGLSVHEAEKTQKWYFSRFPRIKKWQEDLKDQVTKRRMVQNVFGYRCYFFDRIEGTIFNEAAAWIPQSTVACLINRAYVSIDAQLPEVDILLQVHDSLAGQYDSTRAEYFRSKIVSLAEIALPYDDPLVIPVGIKTSPVSWGDCK